MRYGILESLREINPAPFGSLARRGVDEPGERVSPG